MAKHSKGGPKRRSPYERIISRMPKLPADVCWDWVGTISVHGYGQVRVGSLTDGSRSYAPVHRIVYESTRGFEIPHNLVIDHLCRNRKCINPRHLEAVTSAENTMRGHGACAENARKTHCKHGHEFTENNTYIRGKWRTCRKCTAASQRAYRRRKLSGK